MHGWESAVTEEGACGGVNGAILDDRGPCEGESPRWIGNGKWSGWFLYQKTINQGKDELAAALEGHHRENTSFVSDCMRHGWSEVQKSTRAISIPDIC